jgi:hypothetical protein
MARTYEAFRRAESDYQREQAAKRWSSENAKFTLIEKLESRLVALGLGKDQISTQNLKELRQSLHRVDGWIANPGSFLKLELREIVHSETYFKLNIVPILIERKKLILDYVDELVSERKIKNIRQLVKQVSNKNVSASIVKILDELQTKNSLLKREYQKLEDMRLNINYEKQQKFTHISEELTERKNGTRKYLQNRESMTTLMMAILLILITLSIAIAPFVNIQVPDILNNTFLIILGFFFGQTIGRLTRFKKTKGSE